MNLAEQIADTSAFAEYINSSGRNRHVVDPETVPPEPVNPFIEFIEVA
jgi:hypothetical protein